MKKSLISVAVMSLMASPLVIKSVQAQSNVTIYGTVDAGLAYLTRPDTPHHPRLRRPSGSSGTSPCGSSRNGASSCPG